MDAQPLQRVDLKDLCETLLENFLDAATGKGLDLGLEVQPVHVTGHGWLLRELMSNLVDNAIKYTPAGGVVTMRCGQRLVPSGHCGCTWKWKTTARRAEVSAPASCSGFTACPARWARARVWAWPLPTKSAGCTVQRSRWTRERKAEACA